MPDGRIIGGGLVVVGLALAVWGFADREVNDTSTTEQKITQVELRTGSGDVRIETGDTTTTTIEEHREFWLLNGGKAHRIENGKLILEGDCGWQCSASYVVTVPAGVSVTGRSSSGDVVLEGVKDIDLEASSGNVTATGSTGSVSLDLSSGDAVVAGASGAVDLRASSGDITATDLRGGPIKADASSGDIELTLQKPMSVTAEAASGNIDLHVPVPAGTSYKIDGDSNSGEREIGVPTDPASSIVLDLNTKSGDVTVTNAD